VWDGSITGELQQLCYQCNGDTVLCFVSFALFAFPLMETATVITTAATVTAMTVEGFCCE
jgi:hypothetical protein